MDQTLDTIGASYAFVATLHLINGDLGPTFTQTMITYLFVDLIKELYYWKLDYALHHVCGLILTSTTLLTGSYHIATGSVQHSSPCCKTQILGCVVCNSVYNFPDYYMSLRDCDAIYNPCTRGLYHRVVCGGQQSLVVDSLWT